MLTKEQIKAARAMLGWSQKDLAKHCEGSVSEPTIKLIETGKINSTPETLGALQRSFEDAGLEFLPQRGVRFRDDLLRVIEQKDEKDNVYVRLLEDIYHTVKGRYEEVLHSFIDNSLSPPEVVSMERMIRASGATIRHLIRHGDTYLLYPLDEYRYIPKGYYLNSPTAVYADKVAYVVKDRMKGDIEKVLVIHDKDIANVKRREFEILWSVGEQPTQSTASIRYD